MLKGMGMYEPIKGSDDGNTEFRIDLNVKSNNPGVDDEDVEMALRSSDSIPAIPVQFPANAIANPGGAAGGGSGSTKHRQTPQRQRLASLDVFRGLTVATTDDDGFSTLFERKGRKQQTSSVFAIASPLIYLLMILVDYAGGVMPAINHSPWNGITLADYVMPFFLFIVGVSLALTYKKLPGRIFATQKAILRALKLLFLGIFLQGGYLHGLNDLTYGVNIQQMRLMGVLQRIAVAYLVGALCEIWLRRNQNVKSRLCLLTKYQFQWIVIIILTTLYLSLLYGLYVPDWEYQLPSQSSSSSVKTFSVKCGVRGDTGPGCNAAGMIDRKILGIQHLYRKAVYGRTKQCSINSPDYGPLSPDAPSWCQAPFDPEGLLSSVMAIVTCLIGLQYGHILIHFEDHKDRILYWMSSSCCLVLLGLVLDFFSMHMNKALYSFSYMSFTTGSAGILFAGIYLMVDVCRWRRPTMVMEWMGTQALLIYIVATCNIVPFAVQGFYWKHPRNNILRFIGIGK